MDKWLEKMDEALVGPRLFCEFCCGNKVLSPCYHCQYKKWNTSSKKICRGCGDDLYPTFYFGLLCAKKYEICKVLGKERVLLEINEIVAKQKTDGDFVACCLTQFPTEICQAANLTKLDLSSNQLTLLPAEIGLLTNLQVLELEENQLGELPPEIGLLTQLESLDLSWNPLIKLPAEIGQLTSLSYLSLSGRQLSELPVEIGQLTQLSRLSIGFNPSLEKLPAEITKLVNLESLYLSGTPIKKSQVQEIREALPNCKIIGANP